MSPRATFGPSEPTSVMRFIDRPAYRRPLPLLCRRVGHVGGVAVLSGGLLLASATALRAHDFWLVPGSFSVAPGDALEIRGQTSSLFPTSVSAVTPDRLASARIVTPAGDEAIWDLSVSGPSLLLRHRPQTRGQHIVAVQLLPRMVRESPASFRRYMQLEGAPEALARYEREGRLPPVSSTDSLTRSYAKYAKTLVEVGSGGPRIFGRVVGHPLELVPLRDPAAVRAGDALPVQLLLRGRPLAGAHVHAGVIAATGAGPLSDTAAARRAARGDLSLTTDSAGVIRLPVRQTGLWNIRTIQIVPADSGAAADWDVHWATLVFAVGARAPSSAATTPPPSDSAAVAAAVAAYHRALATGDSAAALALLADDAIILESGGSESRAEYRGHHLPADIAFARAVRAERSPVHVTVQGDVAWAWSTSVSQGEHRGRAVNSAGAELMVLTRGSDGRWRIRAIHWSSRTRRP